MHIGKPIRARRARVRCRAAVLAACVGFASPLISLASEYNYIDTTSGGNWNVAANWNGSSPAAVPPNGADAFLGLAGTGGQTISVNFNMAYNGSGLNSLTINAPPFSKSP